MKKFLQILTTAMVGAFLVVGVAGASSNTSDCDIYQKNSTSYNNCLNNLTKTSVQVVCENNVYVINDNSQNAGTGSATITSNGSGGYTASGSAQNTSGTTVTIGATCGQVATTSGSTTPSSPSSPSSSSTAAKKPSSSTAVAAASLPETGSNTVVNAAMLGTALLVGGLVISYVGTALYRRAALKD